MYRGDVVNIMNRRRPRGRNQRPKKRFMDVVTEDVKRVDVRGEDADDRIRSRQMIHFGDA